MSDSWSDFSSTSILQVCEQRRLCRDGADAVDPVSVASDLGVHCLSMSIIWDATLKSPLRP